MNNIVEEILNLCGEDEVEKETLQSLKVLEPYHFVMAELVSSLEKSDVVSLRPWSPPLVKNSCKLPKLELPKFSGNSMDASGFDFIKMKIGLSIVTVKVLCSVEKCLI